MTPSFLLRVRRLQKEEACSDAWKVSNFCQATCVPKHSALKREGGDREMKLNAWRPHGKRRSTLDCSEESYSQRKSSSGRSGFAVSIWMCTNFSVKHFLIFFKPCLPHLLSQPLFPLLFLLLFKGKVSLRSSSQVKSSQVVYMLFYFLLQAMLSAKPWVRGETVASL